MIKRKSFIGTIHYLKNIRIAIFVLLLITIQQAFSQGTWKIKYDVDNFIYMRNAWSSNPKNVIIEIKGIESNCIYTKQLFTTADEWHSFQFPDDFTLLAGESVGISIEQELELTIRERKETKLKTIFRFDPGSNSILQLERYIPTKPLQYDIWGEIVDIYTWEDKLGNNIVVRSFIDKNTQQDEFTTLSTRYLYFYHLRKDENDSLQLIRKFTDSYKNCECQLKTYFELQTIELTDIDRDTIGEISTVYKLACKEAVDSIAEPFTKKVLLTTKGEKYTVQGSFYPEAKKKLIITPSLNLANNPAYDRFLHRKYHKNMVIFR